MALWVKENRPELVGNRPIGQGCPQLLGNRIPLGDKKLRLITETMNNQWITNGKMWRFVCILEKYLEGKSLSIQGWWFGYKIIGKNHCLKSH